jgi:hypothetical protein
MLKRCHLEALFSTSVSLVFENFTLHPGLYIMAIFLGQVMHILDTLWASVLSDNEWKL